MTREIVDTISLTATKLTLTGPIYVKEGMVYEYFKPGLALEGGGYIDYIGTPFTSFVRYAMNRNYSQPIYQLPEATYVRFIIKVYFQIDDEVRLSFEENNYNFFYDKAGLFLNSYWGVITLGVNKKSEIRDYAALTKALVGQQGDTYRVPVSVVNYVPIMGHVSVQVLVEGLIGVLLSLFFLIFMIWGMRDAYKVSLARQRNEDVLTGKKYFKSIWENSFEYIVLSPAIFVLAFISIMPILFGFIMAFTSITGTQSQIDTFDWVGFKNFAALFNFTDGLGAYFGKAFWRVLGWTIIWAVFSTFTCFFGGFFQALILNSESVVFRKFWRTILILPWAIPAILSQMVFSVMFKDTGFINQMLRQFGVYDILTNWGMLGRDPKTLTDFQLIFYLGNQNIEWFSNSFNSTFVRTTLIVVNIWLGFPYFMALMTGIMTSIDKTLYEAADIDGASGWQKLTKITMPLVLYSTAPILIMTFSGNFNNFGVIYFITGGGPNAGHMHRGFAGDTDILISWMYKLTVDEGIYNMASVFSVLIFFVVGSVTAWNLSRTKAFQED